MSRNSGYGLLSAAALAVLGPVAASAATVTGGGANLPSPVFAKIFVDAGLVVGTDISYAAVGSGRGVAAFLGNDSTQFGLPAGTPIDFDGTDTILNSTQVNNFRTTYGYSLIQVPAFGTPITIPFNLPKKTKNASVKLTDDDLCGVFSGKIQDWLNVTNPPVTKSTPITVSYREDSSGTTFLLTNHLAAVCNSGNSRITFAATSSFGTLFGGTVDPVTGYSLVPPGVFAATLVGSSSSSVQSQLHGTTNAVGYIGPDYTLIAAAPTNPTLALPVATIRPAGSSTYYLPNLKNTTAALASFHFTPVATDPTSFGVLVPTPPTGYPIVGYVNVELSTLYSSASKVGIVSSFLNALYNSSGTNTQAVTDINNGGFVPVPGVNANAVPTKSKLAGKIVADYLAAHAVVPIKSAANGR